MEGIEVRHPLVRFLDCSNTLAYLTPFADIYPITKPYVHSQLRSTSDTLVS